MKQLEDFSHKSDSYIWFIIFGVGFFVFCYTRSSITILNRSLKQGPIPFGVTRYVEQRENHVNCILISTRVFYIYFPVLVAKVKSTKQTFPCPSVTSIRSYSKASQTFLVRVLLFASSKVDVMSSVLPFLPSGQSHTEISNQRFNF